MLFGEQKTKTTQVVNSKLRADSLCINSSLVRVGQEGVTHVQMEPGMLILP